MTRCGVGRHSTIFISEIDWLSSAQKNRTPTNKLVVSGWVEPEGELSNFWEDVKGLINVVNSSVLPISG